MSRVLPEFGLGFLSFSESPEPEEEGGESFCMTLLLSPEYAKTETATTVDVAAKPLRDRADLNGSLAERVSVCLTVNMDRERSLNKRGKNASSCLQALTLFYEAIDTKTYIP